MGAGAALTTGATGTTGNPSATGTTRKTEATGATYNTVTANATCAANKMPAAPNTRTRTKKLRQK